MGLGVLSRHQRTRVVVMRCDSEQRLNHIGSRDQGQVTQSDLHFKDVTQIDLSGNKVLNLII